MKQIKNVNQQCKIIFSDKWVISSEEIKNRHNAFFLNLGYLKYIKNIDIFCSSYVIYSFNT